MVLTPSTMLPLGTQAPDFSLLNVDGRTVTLKDFRGAPALLVVFMCNHCPYVKHVAKGLADLARDYQAKGFAVVGISAVIAIISLSVGEPDFATPEHVLATAHQALDAGQTKYTSVTGTPRLRQAAAFPHYRRMLWVDLLRQRVAEVIARAARAERAFRCGLQRQLPAHHAVGRC